MIFDALIIGGGIAGLSCAIKLAKLDPNLSIGLLFKGGIREASTAWAQGGIATVTGNDDSFDLHVKDTMVAGAHLNDEKAVTRVIEAGPQLIEFLVECGVKFDLDEDNNYHLHQEGGHSRKRIFHFRDQTGRIIHEALLATAQRIPSIKFLPFHVGVDLVTSKHLSKPHDRKVFGCYVLDRNGQNRGVKTILAKATILATGGAGKVYLYTSNPDVSTGDGVAMAYRAGCSVANMEFYQFHPTCLYHPHAKSFLITEAMRGEGATLQYGYDESSRFMHNYHELKELAPRDIVARAIDNEIKAKGLDCVYLNIRHRGADFIKEHFPGIHSKCLEFGIDVSKDLIPVVPAAHFACGGISINERGETELENLYAIGECSHSGLHGANRLASNSLLEGLYYGLASAKSIHERGGEIVKDANPWDDGNLRHSDEQVIITQNWEEIRRSMWNYVGIVRSNKRLERAWNRAEMIDQEVNQYYWDFKITSDLVELRNLLLVSKLMIKSALARKESRGLHYNVDYPLTSGVARDTVIPPFLV